MEHRDKGRVTGDKNTAAHHPSPVTRHMPWLVALAALIGVGAGIGGFTFRYAEGFSYLSNDPKACLNCHVMRDVYDGWSHSSHKAVAVCNDCHTPHDFIGKWTTKMLNGWHHSSAFTTGGFHEPIHIKSRNASVLEESCLHCHAQLVGHIAHRDTPGGDTSCVSCHRTVGHGG